MKRFKKALIFVLCFFIIGFVYALFVNLGVIHTFFTSLSLVPWYIYILGVIFTFYLTLTVHELGHLLAFVFQGVKIRALYLTIFVFVNDKKSVRFKIKPKLWVLLGGLVIPNLHPIENQEDYEKTVKIFRNALIAAPITTITYLSLSIFTFILGMLFLKPSLWLGILILSAIYTSLLSALYIYTFGLSTENIYGDFVAYKKMEKDPIFTFAQISQYTSFSTFESKDEEAFIYQKATDILKVAPNLNDFFIQNIMLHYFEGILKHDYPLDEVIESKLRNINMNQFIRHEQGLLAYHEMIRHDYKLKDVESAYRKYEQVKLIKRKKIDEKLINYLNHRTAHQIHLEDHQAFLENESNFYIGDNWIFEPVLDPYQDFMDDKEKLPFIPYLCEVELDKKLEED